MYLNFGAKLKIESFRRVWGGGGWVPQDLRGVKALVSGKKFRPPLATQSNLFPKLICFFYVETQKVSTSTRGGVHDLLYKTFLEHVHSARSSCTADTRPLNGFENGPTLAENIIEYVLLDNLRWEFHLFLSEPGSAQFAAVRKSYRQMGLRSGISLRIRKSISESGIILIVWRGLGWVFETQERKKERKSYTNKQTNKH